MRSLSNRQLRGVFDEMSAIAGEFVSDFADVGPNISEACTIQASNEVSGVDLDIKDVQDNWKPTNFYSIDQIRQIVAFGMQVQSNALQTLQTAASTRQLESHREFLDGEARSFINTQNNLISPDEFIKAVQQADAMQATSNVPVIIESSGLKRWVVNTLKAARRVRFIAAAVACARPDTVLGVADALVSAWNALVAFVKTVVGVIKTALDIVLKIPDFLSTVFTILKALPTVLVLGGGYYVATKTVLKKRDPWRPWKKLHE